ncbi:glycosyltransferase involved in cell wall biosynthesis [Rhizobium pisi]|uniref:Glycosyltransferase n=1 Tax=Rhizobium pisi TaxID=574561 RepID=A0A427N417_9HYPH|nr:glycosyltransferase family 2 protein [Rhizobium pisi]MBB3133613.1 glycosyltransferase involved in cell wall biosynthesis [Rhizobium pisi]RSB81625.1 glycosyltransferase [Rhizobium pisi]TCA46705.1 glycosyltransferase [Rhizobium pisi]
MRATLSELGVGTTLRRMAGLRLGLFQQYPPRPLSIATIGRSGDDRNLPRISLVTPSFNQTKFVGMTLDSVLAQHYPDLQYIVQDAVSSDGSQAILANYRDRGVDIIVEADKGQTNALNRGFARSSGEIMAYLNSDDMLLPGTLHLVGRYFRDNPSVEVIYGNRLVVDEQGSEIGRWILPGHDEEILRFVDYVPQETMFWRRGLWERVGAGFDERFHFAMDWDLILRFMQAGAVFNHVPELFGLFRVHGNQKSQTDFRERGAREMAELRHAHANGRMNTAQRIIRHIAYLLKHKRADAALQVALRKNG